MVPSRSIAPGWEKTMRSFIAAGAAAVVLAAAGSSRAADKIEWAKSYDAALKAGKESGKLVMVDVYADWCGPCKLLEKQTYADPKVVAFAKEKLVSVKVDADSDAGKEIAKKFEVDSLPTILFLDGDGKAREKIVGFVQARPFYTKALGYSLTFKGLSDLQAALKKNAGDAKAAAAVAMTHIAYGRMTDAEKVMAEALKAGAGARELTPVQIAIGDAHQEAGRLDQAMREFRKAADAAEPNDKVYALSSIAACLASKGDMKEALATVDKALAVEGASGSEKKDAEALRDQLKEASEGAEKQAAGKEKAAKLMGWAKNFEDALAKAKESKKYAMVDFTADWCVYCKKLEAEVFADEKAAKSLRESVVAVQVDVESKEGEPIAKRYRTMIADGLPAIVFVDGEGDVVGRIVGFKPADEFVQATNDVVKAAKEFPNVLAAWKKDDKNVDAGLKVVKTYLDRGDYKNVQAVLKKLEERGVELSKLGPMYFQVARALILSGEGESSEAILKRLSTDGNANERAQALMMMASTRAQRGDLAGAVDLADQAVKIEGLNARIIQQIQDFRKSLQDVIDAQKEKKDKKDG
jgi:thiol-disulfide isomerase/thioredoxin